MKKIKTGSVTMTSADTQYEIAIPHEAENLRIDIDHGHAWRFSETTGVVAGGGGSSVQANDQPIIFMGPLAAHTLYVASGSAGKALRYSYELPARRG